VTVDEARKSWNDRPYLHAKHGTFENFLVALGVRRGTWQPPGRRAASPPDAAPVPALKPAAPPKLSTTQRWEHALAAKVAAEMSRGEAISARVDEQLELHEEWLAEVNSKPAPPEPMMPSSLVPFPRDLQSTDPAVTLFSRAVGRHMTLGLSRGQAVRQVASETPALHAAYLAAVA